MKLILIIIVNLYLLKLFYLNLQAFINVLQVRNLLLHLFFPLDF